MKNANTTAYHRTTFIKLRFERMQARADYPKYLRLRPSKVGHSLSPVFTPVSPRMSRRRSSLAVRPRSRSNLQLHAPLCVTDWDRQRAELTSRVGPTMPPDRYGIGVMSKVRWHALWFAGGRVFGLEHGSYFIDAVRMDRTRAKTQNGSMPQVMHLARATPPHKVGAVKSDGMAGLSPSQT